MSEIKHCNKCDVELVVGENWLASCKKCGTYECNPCRKERMRKHDGTDAAKELKRKYSVTPSQREYHRKYRATEVNKKYRRKYNSAAEAKRRGLGYIELFPNPFPPEVKVHWHHIDRCHVVALPAKIHQSAMGGGITRLEHIEKLRLVVDDIYFNKFDPPHMNITDNTL